MALLGVVLGPVVSGLVDFLDGIEVLLPETRVALFRFLFLLRQVNVRDRVEDDRLLEGVEVPRIRRREEAREVGASQTVVVGAAPRILEIE